MTKYKVIYFTDNGVIMCITKDTEAGARDFATTLGSRWYVIVSYVTATTVTDITTPTI
jgi:hypothetical protein